MIGGQEIRDVRDWIGQAVQAAYLWPDTSGAETVAPYDARHDLASTDVPPESAHRRYQVRMTHAERLGGKAGTVAGATQDIAVTYVVRMSYYVGGGDQADLTEIEALAMQDAEAIRQKLEHPLNHRDMQHDNVGLWSLEYSGTDVSTEGERLFASSSYVAHIRVFIEAA